MKLSEITTGRVERWRATRRNQRRRSESAEKKTQRPVSGATINRDIQALRAALARAAEWGSLSSNPLARMKQGSEDENAVIRHLSREEEQRLRGALAERDDARRAARKSANTWRTERGYEPWPATARTLTT